MNKSISSEARTIVKLKDVEEEDQNPSFHQSVGPALAYGQFFGLLPVDGVLEKDENRVEFRWRSIKTIYSMIFLFCGTVESCLGTRRLLRLGFKINFAEGLLFFITAMVRAFIVFRLARHWKEIIKRWRHCEDVFLKPPYRVRGWSLSLRIRVIFILLAALSAGKWEKFFDENREMPQKAIFNVKTFWFQPSTFSSWQRQLATTSSSFSTAARGRRFSGRISCRATVHICCTIFLLAPSNFRFMRWAASEVGSFATK